MFRPATSRAILFSKLIDGVSGSISGRACQPSRLELSVVFSETHVNTAKDSLERPPTEGTPSSNPSFTIDLNPTIQPNPLPMFLQENRFTQKDQMSIFKTSSIHWYQKEIFFKVY